jgi:hypothetical protein
VTGVIHVNVISITVIQIGVGTIDADRDHAIDPAGIITREAVRDPMNAQEDAKIVELQNLKSLDPEVTQKYKNQNTIFHYINSEISTRGENMYNLFRNWNMLKFFRQYIILN